MTRPLLKPPGPAGPPLKSSGTTDPPRTRMRAFSSEGLWLRPLDQMDATLVSGSEGARNPFFSADGQWLGFWADDQLKRVSVSGGARSWTPLLATNARESDPAISPDGQWIAYASGETGRVEVYVQRFPELGLRQQISTDGGLRPAWSPDARALFYLGTRGGSSPQEMAVVTIDPGPPLSVGNPEVLFDYAPYIDLPAGGRQYDVDPNGQRFLMLSNTTGDDGTVLTPQINIVLNWTQELLERVPVP